MKTKKLILGFSDIAQFWEKLKELELFLIILANTNMVICGYHITPLRRIEVVMHVVMHAPLRRIEVVMHVVRHHVEWL